jgi:hypothetical protein
MFQLQVFGPKECEDCFGCIDCGARRHSHPVIEDKQAVN